MSTQRPHRIAGTAARDSSRLRAALLVFFLALAVRLVYLAEISKSPAFDVPIIDSQSYDQHARLLLSEGTFPTRFFWQGFFYPFFLSGVYLAAGGSLLAARLVQIVLGSLMCTGVHALGARLFDRRVGICAGVITALYGPLVFYEAEILDTGFSAIWAVVLLLLLVRAAEAKGSGWALLLGFAGGLSVITRATFLPFFAAACAWLVWSWRRARVPRGVAAGRAGFLVAGFAAVALPVAALCHRTTGDFDFLPASGPINLFIGNNPESERTIMIRPGEEWRELTRMPEMRGSQSGSEDRSVFMRLFLDYARKEPGSYLRGLARKTAQFASSRELPRNDDTYIARDYSKLFSALTWKAGPFGFPFGLLLPLAIVGIVRFRGRLPVPVYLFVVLYPAAIVAVFVSGRYRIPLVPVLAVPAAAGLGYLAGLFRARRIALAAAVVAAMCAIAAASSIAGPFAVEEYDYRAEMHTIVGFELMKRSRTAEALEELSEALRVNPDWPDAHRYVGIIMSGQRRHAEAAEHFRRALARKPDSSLLRYYYGMTLLNMGKRDEGFEQLRISREEAAAAKDEGLLREIDKVLPSVSPAVGSEVAE